MAFRQSIPDFVRPWLLSMASALAMAPWLRPEAESESGVYAMLACAVAVLVSGYLLFPARALRSPHAVLGWSGATGAGTLVYGLMLAPAVPPLVLLRLGFAIAVLLVLLLFLRHAVARKLPDTASGAAVALFGAVCGSAPLWLSPWVERTDGAAWLTDFALGISPLTYFAVMLDCDYLRSTWFYEHTPFGAYRYDYPSPVLLTMIHAVLGTGAWWLGRQRREPAPEALLSDLSS